MIKRRLLTIPTGLLILCLSIQTAVAAGFTTTSDWNETAVRKVLQTFAYGGFASDAQITTWAAMPPEVAITEILTFDAANPKLSPIQDKSAWYGYSLQSLQDFWSGGSTDNPVREDRRLLYNLLYSLDTGEKFLAAPFLKNTWVQAATTRGINPFLHRVGFYLTNYHMALSVEKTRAGLMRDFYDRTIVALQQGGNMVDVLALGATSAAVAYAYGHMFNYIDYETKKFMGNDDFAREFHQLFFRIQGVNEEQDYHENTTIENTAHALTGMMLDYSNPWGSSFDFEWGAAPIDFSDHEYTNGYDVPVQVYNTTAHHQGDLEILHQTISGSNAAEKMYYLAYVASEHQESLDNIPVTIIDYFADDNLNGHADKLAAIRQAWLDTNKDLLAFLRAYAISTTFHREDTYKFRNAFDRNLLVHNFNTIDNAESFARNELPIPQMLKEGADVFDPAHDVFGGQTGLQAANNPNIFREAFQRNVLESGYLARVSHIQEPVSPVVWEKDWAQHIPKNSNGQYDVKSIADWLWKRFIGDGGKHFQIQEQAQLYALLAYGVDFGYIVDQGNPDQAFSSEQLQQSPLIDYINALSQVTLSLEDSDINLRRNANYRIGMAVNFITITPFMFAMEGK